MKRYISTSPPSLLAAVIVDKVPGVIEVAVVSATTSEASERLDVFDSKLADKRISLGIIRHIEALAYIFTREDVIKIE
jgi:hypothetical protein